MSEPGDQPTPLTDWEAVERAREYLRRAMAFQGIEPLLWGLLCFLTGCAFYFSWPIVLIPNFSTYLLIALLVSRELASNKMKQWAAQKGTLPQAWPPPPESLPYVQTYASVAKVLGMGFWISFVGGYVFTNVKPPGTAIPVGVYLSQLSILFLLAGYAWDFLRSGLWERLLMCGCLGGAAALWWFATPTLATSIFAFLLFGGGFILAGVCLLQRWWSWAKTLPEDQRITRIGLDA